MSTLLEPAAPGSAAFPPGNAPALKLRMLPQLHTAAERMEKARLHVVAHALRFTAAQVQEQTAILRGMMQIPLQTCADISLPHQPHLLMRHFARASEDARAAFAACAAQAEEFPRLHRTFLRIAETDSIHVRRFRQYETALAEGTLFRDARRVTWLCLHCGELHTGFEPPPSCPGCGKDHGHFIRSSYFPFSVEG